MDLLPHGGAHLLHGMKRRHGYAFGFGIGVGHANVPPHPAFLDAGLDRLVAEADIVQGRAVQRHPARCFAVGLDVHHERPALTGDVEHPVLGRRRTDHVGMWLGVGRGSQHGQLEVEEPAVMLEFFTFPGFEHDRLGFFEPGLCFGVVNAEPLVVVYVVGGAPAQPDDQPPFAQVVDQRDLLGHADGVVQRHLRHGETDAGARGRHRQSGGEGDGVDIGADAVEMMLGQPDHVIAELVRKARLPKGFVDDPGVIRRGSALGKQEVGEFHPTPLRGCGVSIGRCGFAGNGLRDTLRAPPRECPP